MNFLLKAIRYIRFYFVWKSNNKHNLTVAKNIFPLNLVDVGKGTYGPLYIIYFYSKFEEIKSRVKIGNYCSIAGNVKFFLCENHQVYTLSTYPLKSMLIESSLDDAVSKGDIIIEDEVWIGYGATILSGVKISKGAIVATGSVVVKDVPPYAIVAGNPATIVKYRFKEEIIQKIKKIQLADLDENFVKENIHLFYKKLTDDNVDEILEVINANVK